MAMKLRIFLIFTIFVAVLLLLSCSEIPSGRSFDIEISCDEFGESNHRSGELGIFMFDKITVKLCSNQTAGFQWDYEMTVESVLIEEDHDFEEPAGNTTGGAGTEIWTFKPVGAGTTQVQMEYGQPWEGGLESEWTYNMTVRVYKYE
jgi:predicted secreted protein